MDKPILYCEQSQVSQHGIFKLVCSESWLEEHRSKWAVIWVFARLLLKTRTCGAVD